MTILSLATSLGPLELKMMERLWLAGPQTARDLLIAMSADRPRAYTTISTTLDRLYARGLLARDLVEASRRQTAWCYMPRVSKGALLATAIEQLCANVGADRGDRAEALAMILGAPR